MVVNLEQQLSPHFTLRECVRANHRTIDNSPDVQIVYRLTQTCCWAAEPLRNQFGPMWVDSGYRCPALNLAVGGAGGSDVYAANASAHLFGVALDLVPIGRDVAIADMMRWLWHSNIPFDQIIDEGTTTGAWLHLGMLRPGHEPKPRREAWVMRSGIYTVWTPAQAQPA
jgi:hypothetical protein